MCHDWLTLEEVIGSEVDGALWCAIQLREVNVEQAVGGLAALADVHEHVPTSAATRRGVSAWRHVLSSAVMLCTALPCLELCSMNLHRLAWDWLLTDSAGQWFCMPIPVHVSSRIRVHV